MYCAERKFCGKCGIVSTGYYAALTRICSYAPVRLSVYPSAICLYLCSLYLLKYTAGPILVLMQRMKERAQEPCYEQD